MRILHLVAHSQRRGAETAALELAEELELLGHTNRLLALTPAFDGTSDPALPTLARGVRAGPLTLAAGTWRLRRSLACDPAEVVLAHGGQAVQVAALATRRRRPPIVWQRILRFPPGFWRSARRRWWERVVRRIDAAVALTPELAHEVLRLGFTGPVWVIGNSRRPDRFVNVDRTEARARLRREVGVTDAVALLGLVGHLIEQKRPERAVAVLDEILRAGERAHLVIAGTGPLRDDVAAEVARRGLRDHVTMLGHRTNVELVLAGLDVLLLTSDAEGIPGVVIEAQMAGCPVVTFPLGGVGSVVDHGRTGIVLEHPDVHEMATETTHLLRHSDLRNALGDAARARAPELSTSRAARIYAQRLGELLEASDTAGR